MRHFAPKYRLINGKPFPATDAISTDQGHKVLLRYVNVGAADARHERARHGPTQLAQDGHQMTYPARMIADTVEPGATPDTLVTMPSGPESKLALFEAAEHLDNNAPDDS